MIMHICIICIKYYLDKFFFYVLIIIVVVVEEVVMVKW